MGSTDLHPFAGTPAGVPSGDTHDLDLGDGHWIDWSYYKDECCGGIITHTTAATGSGFCAGAFTIRGSKWDLDYPGRASWKFNEVFAAPTLEPSFLCHCGDHGFVREGRWVKA